MNEYIIRTSGGTEKCVISDNINIDYGRFQANFWHNYSYTEYNGEYCNYCRYQDKLVIPLIGIKFIGLINPETGQLETLYKAREER